MKILVTGGTGFIGSHTTVELLNSGYDVVVIDNLSNSNSKVIDHIFKITGKKVSFYEGSVLDKDLLNKIFREHTIDIVIHFAGYKAVGESVAKPLLYYDNNLISTIHLCEVMQKFNCKKLIFSSSATVYGNPKTLPIREDAELHTTNPYGTTKWMNEIILNDLVKADPTFSVILLRYFNPVGAHESGLIGENPNGIPNNLMPYIVKVATRKLDYLHIFGSDYETKDGTGVRDYIHVVDLAKGHVKAVLKCLETSSVHIYNLGTGKGYSVLEMVKTFEKVNGVKIPYQIEGRRSGDIDACFADCSCAFKELNWKCEKTIEDMCRDAYHFARQFE